MIESGVPVATLLFICAMIEQTGSTHPPSKHDNRPFHMLKNSGDLEEGRQQYTSALANSKLPRFGDCWKRALERLHADCDGLTNERNSRLAFTFANCFLGESGKATYPCSRADDMSHCVGVMDSIAFHAYTTFFTNTINMCFFLKSQVWHEETEGTIGRLIDTSSKVESQMHEHMELQRRSLDNERQLLDRGHELNRAMENSKAGVEQILVQFQETTGEQRLFIGQLFDRLVKFHSLVVGEFAGVYSLVFFVVAVTLCYLLTSAKQTAAARFWLFCIIGVNLAIERLAIQWRLEENVLRNSDNVQNIIYDRVWFVRKISSYLALTTLVTFACRYRDINVVNNELLKIISQQNSEISSRLGSIGGHHSKDQTFRSRRDAGTQSSSEEFPDTSSTSFEDTLASKAIGNRIRRTPADRLSCAVTNGSTRSIKMQKKERAKESSAADSLQGNQIVPIVSHYNFRSRKSITAVNPILDVEPPEKFAATIERLAKISASNSLNFRRVLREQRSVRGALLSSDED